MYTGNIGTYGKIQNKSIMIAWERDGLSPWIRMRVRIAVPRLLMHNVRDPHWLRERVRVPAAAATSCVTSPWTPFLHVHYYYYYYRYGYPPIHHSSEENPHRLIVWCRWCALSRKAERQIETKIRNTGNLLFFLFFQTRTIFFTCSSSS